MKIAIYHPWIKSKGGAERVILELVTRLKQHDWTIFTSLYDAKNTFPEFRRLRINVLSSPLHFLGKSFLGFIARGAVLGIAAALTKIRGLDKFDVFVVSTSGLGEIITLRNRPRGLPIICYCHTPLRAVHEFYDYYEGKFKATKLLFKIAVKVYRFFERRAWGPFSLVLCNSKNTRGRVLRAGLADAKKIRVIYPGVDTKKFRPVGIWKKYFLVPGRFKNYKRFELALEAFGRLSAEAKDFEIIVVGHPDDEKYLSDLEKTAEKISGVRFVLSPTDKELIKLYQNCYAVVFTAKNEDWGIVPLEAGACGKPTISVAEGGALESIVNGKTGLLVPATPTEIATAMSKLIKNPVITKRIGRAARQRVLRFDWQNFARNFETQLESVKK